MRNYFLYVVSLRLLHYFVLILHTINKYLKCTLLDCYDNSIDYPYTMAHKSVRTSLKTE